MKKGFLDKIRIIVLCFALLICSFCVSCGESVADTKVFGASFCAEIAWKEENVDFLATVEVGGTEVHPRDVSMRMLSPECVCGTELRQINGVAGLDFDGIFLGSAACDAYLDVAQMLVPDGSFTYKCKTELGGDELLCYCAGDSLWYFSAFDGRIKRIEKGSRIIDVRWIEPK